MKAFWDQRYNEQSYAYGKEPNRFFKETLDGYKLSGKILLAAEGEGRNAVYAAKKGLEVYAFDISEVGMQKALKLAQQAQLNFHYEVGELDSLNLAKMKFDVAALIYAHFPPNILSHYHQKIGSLVKPAGYLILEGFSKNNLALRAQNPKVGGPDKEEMLFSLETIASDFPDFEPILLKEQQIALQEGKYHNGTAKVIRFIGQKKG